MELWQIVERQPGFEKQSKKGLLSAQFVKRVCMDAALTFGLADVESAEKGVDPVSDLKEVSYNITDVFLDQVDAQLPPQPWKPGINRQVATALGCSPGKVSKAIDELVGRGRRNRQKEGVVFDREGNVIAIDRDRVDRPTEDVEKLAE